MFTYRGCVSSAGKLNDMHNRQNFIVGFNADDVPPLGCLHSMKIRRRYTTAGSNSEIANVIVF
jgi:hypothetical protein